MFLIELWNDYLSKTMPVLSGLGVPLAFFQMLAGLPSLLSLYHSVRRDSAWERVMLCMVPGIFIVAVAIVEPLFFGSFLGEGFPWTDALRTFLCQPAFFRETMALSSCFLLLAILSLLAEQRDSRLQERQRACSRWSDRDGGLRSGGDSGQWSDRDGGRWSGRDGGPRSGRFLFGNAVELILSLALLVLAADYFIGSGRMLASLADAPLKWLVYGVYLLLYKCGLLFLCLVWRLLFGERPQTDAAANPRRWLRRYLSHSYRAFGWSVLMFSALWALAVVRGLYREGSPYLWALALNIALAALGLLFLIGSLLLPAYRRILTWGEPEETFRQLYRELAEQPPLARTDIGFLTEHYLVITMPWRGIFCRALLEQKQVQINAVGACVLRFEDGSRCRINTVYRALLDPLLGESAAYKP